MRQAVRMNGASPLRDYCMIPLRDECLSIKAGVSSRLPLMD